MATKNWFITGVSTGFGRELSKAALARGDKVVGTLRKQEQFAEFEALAPGRAIAVQADVTNPAQVTASVARAIEVLGHVDVLVNNAGYGLFGSIEQLTEEQIDQQFAVNTFGAIRVTRALLPHLRERRAGKILQISSVAGQTGAAGLGIYNASKWALEGFSEALSYEVRKLGIHVVLIEPGAFRTDWAGRSMDRVEPLPDYAGTVGRVAAYLDQGNGKQPGDPKKAAAFMLEIADMDTPPLRIPFGADSYDSIKQKLTRQLSELTAWEQKAKSLSFEGD